MIKPDSSEMVYYLLFLNKFAFQISHNVPAVYDILPARIRACGARPGLAKCGGGFAWECSVAE
jgi:hypothetical protein